MVLVKLVLGEVAVQACNAAFLFDLLEAAALSRLELVDNFGGGDVIDLVKIANAPLDDLDEDERLDDGISRCSDLEIGNVGLVEHTQCVTEVLLDLTLGGNANFVLLSLSLFFLDFLVALHHFVVFG